MSLPREVLKWLQSLDLSYPVRNPKRDFQNGYLVAEIFSRYFPGDDLLNVDLLYTGEGSVQKGKNWEQLEKFFKKHQIHIPPTAIHSVSQGHVDAAAMLLEELYSVLTKRRLHGPRTKDAPKLAADHVPHFQLPTTANIIRSVDGSPEKAKVILEAHREYIKSMRVLAHTKQPTKPRAASPTLTRSTTTTTQPAIQTQPPKQSQASYKDIRTGLDHVPVQQIRVHQNLV
ncbi:uncharacterized protein EV422DRAFT_79612 [Fimicolochytrium jonesii]|uniref:uncharacterized protein n=1 Tax=Fimicolochytrium jonesii TaxID=1396493 RepID=UPI0022FE058E|nr:uncharacterized protein EV422DRAFT_79612 [Fimicolochytrium jonesii]KAI8820115.1 hypothetical protein EV422DRAFT_79612 [Fimicolochytrium jonesii]